jgi:hypothetical protein
MASTPIASISRLDLQSLSIPSSAVITDVKHLSSYNWIEAPTPTIAVPGCPALWSAPSVAQRLKKDSGLIYIAQNAVRHPESPLEPLFRALYVTNPEYDISSVDVVSDRNNIRKLLAFVNVGSERSGHESFTIRVEVTKNTAILCREETATHEVIGAHEFRGFGHEFEKANTTSQIPGSTGHHRIISYRFGDLHFLIRHETDGYVRPAAHPRDAPDDTLARMLGSLSLSTTTGPSTSTSSARPQPLITTPAGSKLTIRHQGQPVPLACTLEIKTRVSHKPLAIPDLAAQLWVSQTPKLVRAYHKRGVFPRPEEVEDVTSQIQSWEEGHQSELRKLAGLIRWIVGVVKGCSGSARIRYEEEHGDRLVVWKADGPRMLPVDLYARWDDPVQAGDAGGEGAEATVEGRRAQGGKSGEKMCDRGQ